MKNLSLKIKTFFLLIFLVLLSTVPLIAYYLNTAQAISELGSDPAIETSLSCAIDMSVNAKDKEMAADALKKYRQITVLKARIVNQVLIFSIIYSIAVVIVSLLIGYVFISKITRPLSNLTEATHRLALDEPDIKLEEKAGGEIGALIKSFNKMAGDLKITRQQRDIAERRATWQRVARTIAHEIKNPLTPIKLSTERMYDKYLNQSKDFSEVIKSTTATILNEIGNLQKLVDTFHKYAKFPDPVLKPEFLNQIAIETAVLFKGTKANVSCSLDDNVPLLPLDKGQIKEALINLIKNGIEAAEQVSRQGQVQISSRYIAGSVRVTVEDNGCGISFENQKKLFQPYFTTKRHGNGIGLALTERIITLNGGKISFESEEGKGTKFTIIFSINHPMPITQGIAG